MCGLQKPGNSAAVAVFRASLLYLPAVMAALLLDRVPVKHSEEAPAFRWYAGRLWSVRISEASWGAVIDALLIACT